MYDRSESMRFPRIIRGGRVTLRELTEADVGGHYVEWMNDPQVTRYLESRFVSHTQGSLSAYVRTMSANPDVLLLAIVRENDGRHIGNVKLGPIDRHHLVGDVGILIGDKECWGQGYATESISALTTYAFAELGLRKLCAGAYSINHGSVRAFLKAGWYEEARRPSQFIWGGEAVDEVLLGILRSS